MYFFIIDNSEWESNEAFPRDEVGAPTAERSKEEMRRCSLRQLIVVLIVLVVIVVFIVNVVITVIVVIVIIVVIVVLVVIVVIVVLLIYLHPDGAVRELRDGDPDVSDLTLDASALVFIDRGGNCGMPSL